MLRTRSEENLTDLLCVSGGTHKDCVSPRGPWTSNYVDLNGYKKTMTDVVVDRFHARVANGEVIVNPMSSTETVRFAGGNTASYSTDGGSYPCDWYTEYPNGHIIWLGMDTPYGDHISHQPVPLDITQLKILAGTQAKASVLEADFAGATFVAELSKTIKFLANPIQSFYKQLLRLQKRRLTAAEKFSNLREFIENGWLTYRCGIMPLVYQTRDAARAVENVGKNPERYTARGSAQNDGTVSVIQTASSGVWDIERAVETTRQLSVRSGIIYEHDSRNSFGVSLRDVADAAWEVVPFSFVVDWFANVNDFIGAIAPKVGVRTLGSWTTTYDQYASTGVGSGVYSAGNPDDYAIVNPTSGESLYTLHKTRHKNVAIGLAFQPTPYKGDLGKKRIADTIALIDRVLLSR